MPKYEITTQESGRYIKTIYAIMTLNTTILD